MSEKENQIAVQRRWGQFLRGLVCPETNPHLPNPGTPIVIGNAIYNHRYQSDPARRHLPGGKLCDACLHGEHLACESLTCICVCEEVLDVALHKAS
jgi:hypothetical protein